MRRTMLTAKPVALPAPVFQTRTTGGTTAATSVSVTIPTGTTSGDLIIVSVGGSKTAVPTTSMSGYTKLLEAASSTGSAGGFLSIYAKIAGASESAVTFSVGAGNANMTYVAERWSGVGSLPTAGLTGNSYITTSPAMTSNTVSTTTPNSIVYTVIGGRATATGNVSPSWGAGATSFYGTASGRIGFCNIATETEGAAATDTHTCSITNTQNPAVSQIGSVVLSPSLDVAPPSVPSYVPAGEESKYNLETGGFNFNSGNTTNFVSSLTGAGSALAKHLFLGDSVGEGWISFNGVSGTADRPNAFPHKYKEAVCSELGITNAGSGDIKIKSTPSFTTDPRWSNSNSWTGSGHYGSTAAATNDLTSGFAGTIVEVYHLDKNDLRVTIDGTDHVVTGGNTGVPTKTTFSGLSNTTHTVVVRPNGVSTVSVNGGSVHKSTGLLVHNVSQGGSKLNGTGQPIWGDTSSGYDNLVPFYSTNTMDDVDVVFIELGGNDMQSSPFDYDLMMTHIEDIAGAWPSADIVLIMILQGGAGFTGDYAQFWSKMCQLSIDNDWPLFDTQYITGGYANMINNGWATDAYGHLTVTGATYLGSALATAAMTGAGLM